MELCSVLYGSLKGRGVRGRMDTCICTAESLHCSPYRNTVNWLYSIISGLCRASVWAVTHLGEGKTLQHRCWKGKVKRGELVDQQKLRNVLCLKAQDRIGMGKRWALTLQTNQTPCCLPTAILALQDTKMYYLKNTHQKYLRLRNTMCVFNPQAWTVRSLSVSRMPEATGRH